MKRINFGIIGVGKRGNEVGNNVLMKNPKINLLAVCDNDSNRLKDWESKKIKAYKDYRELINDKDIDAVFITTPDNTHAEISIAALKSGKHVICEKPLEITKEKIMEILKEAKKHEKIFMIGYVLRYAATYKKMKQLVEDGIIGKVILAQATDNINYGGYAFYHDWHRERKYTNSLLLQKASHSLDILDWVIDSKPIKVCGFGGLDVFGAQGAVRVFGKTIGNNLKCSECSKITTCEESPINIYRMRGITWENGWPDSCVYTDTVDVDDNQVLIIKYANGVKATYTLCQFTPEYKREYTFIGEKGKLTADDKSNTITVTYRGSKEVDSYKVLPGEGHGGGDEGLIEDFIECYNSGKRPVASVEDGAISALLALAAQESIEKNEVINVKTI